MLQQVPTCAFHVMVKLSGSDCNLNCDYCFYLEKQSLYCEKPVMYMDDDMLEVYVCHYIAASETQNEVAFTWQGGEPMLLGLDFYCCAVVLQAKYGADRKISNSFQTNGVLLDDEWCAFLAENHFLVGLLLDGLAEIHNQYCVTKGGRPMHKLVMCALMLLQKHHVDYNVLVCVNCTSVLQPLQVYDFLCDAGVEFIQFIPVVECLADEMAVHAGLKLHAPGDIQGELMEWLVCPEEFGEFLVVIFDHWIKRDVGKIFVMNIEWVFANFVGVPGVVCHHQPTCGRLVIVEHNGDVYACDHYVYLQY